MTRTRSARPRAAWVCLLLLQTLTPINASTPASQNPTRSPQSDSDPDFWADWHRVEAYAGVLIWRDAASDAAWGTSRIFWYGADSDHLRGFTGDNLGQALIALQQSEGVELYELLLNNPPLSNAYATAASIPSQPAAEWQTATEQMLLGSNRTTSTIGNRYSAYEVPDQIPPDPCPHIPDIFTCDPPCGNVCNLFCPHYCDLEYCPDACNNLWCFIECNPVYCPDACLEPSCPSYCLPDICPAACGHEECPSHCNPDLCPVTACADPNCEAYCDADVCSGVCQRPECPDSCNPSECSGACNREECPAHCNVYLCPQACNDEDCAVYCSPASCPQACSRTECPAHCNPQLCEQACQDDECSAYCNPDQCSQSCERAACPVYCNTWWCDVCEHPTCDAYCDYHHCPDNACNPLRCVVDYCYAPCGSLCDPKCPQYDPCQCNPCLCIPSASCCDDYCCGDLECPEGNDQFDNPAIGNIRLDLPVFTTHAGQDDGLSLSFTYNSIYYTRDDGFGPGWTHDFNLYLYEVPLGGGYGLQAVIIDGEGRRSSYWRWPDGTFATPPGRQATLVRYSTNYELQFWDGTRWVFSTSPLGGGRYYVNRIISREGRETVLQYGGLPQRLSRITDPWGQESVLNWDLQANPQTLTITHPDGMQTILAYQQGRLSVVLDPLGHVRQFHYAPSPEPRRITKDIHKNGNWYTYAYSPNMREVRDKEENLVYRLSSSTLFPGDAGSLSAGAVLHTDGDDFVWTILRDHKGRIISRATPVVGDLPALTLYGAEYTDDENYITQKTDHLGFNEHFEYDLYGNLTQKSDKAGHVRLYEFGDGFWPKAVTKAVEPDGDEWIYTYDPPTGDRLTLADPLIESPLDKVITYAHTYFPPDDSPTPPALSEGRPRFVDHTDRNGHRVLAEFSAQGFLLRTIVDPGGLDLLTEYINHNMLGLPGRMIEHRGPDDTVVTDFEYDAMGRLLSETVDPDWLSLATSYTYDAEGNRLTLTNPRGVVTRYEYDHRDRLSKVWEDFGGPAQTLTEYFYNNRNKLVLQRDANEHETSYEYNARGQLVRSTDAEGNQTHYESDAEGRLLTVRRNLEPGSGGPQQVLFYTYDALGRRTTRVLDPAGLNLTTELEYTNPDGPPQLDPATPGTALLHQLTDPRGKLTYVYYDELDRMTRLVWKNNDLSDNGGDADDAVYTVEYDAEANRTAVVNPEGERIEFAYDAADRLTTHRIDPAGFNLQTNFIYDGSSNVRQATLPNGNIVIFTYDRADRLVSAGDSVGLIAGYSYDASGNVVGRTDGLGRAWQFEFDRLDRLDKMFDPTIETPVDKCTAYQYDALGNRTIVTNNIGVKTKYVYDDIDRLIQMIEDFEGLDPSTADTPTTYSYDGAGQILTLSDSDGNTTDYTYDPAGRVIRVAYPETPSDSGESFQNSGAPGHLVSDSASDVVLFPHQVPSSLNQVILDYDAADNLVGRRDQNGVTTTFTYNDHGRLTDRNYSTGRHDQFEYDLAGRLTRALNDVVDREFAYDALGRLSQTHQEYLYSPGPFTTTISYLVSPVATQRTLTYPGGRVITENYDARFRLDDVGALGVGVVTDWTYNPVNLTQSTTLGNGIASTFEYDLNDRLTSLRHAKQASSLFHVQYGWDAASRRTFTRDLVSPTNSELYVHDDRDRLVGFARGTLNASGTAITTPTPASYLIQSKDWNLDRRGNWLDSATTIAGQPTTDARQANSVNEYTQWATTGGPPVLPSHDKNGNLINDGQKTYAYDEENQLRTVTLIGASALALVIQYDALGNRVTSLENGTDMTWHISAGGPGVLEEREGLSASQAARSATSPRGATGNAWGATGSLPASAELHPASDVASGVSPDEEPRTAPREEPRGFSPRGAEAWAGWSTSSYVFNALRNVIPSERSESRNLDAPDSEPSPALPAVGWPTSSESGNSNPTDMWGSRPRLPSGSSGGSGQLLREFIYGRDFLEPLVLIDHTAAGSLPAGTDEPLYYLQDILRSVTALTDSAGNIVERYRYEPYGATHILDSNYSPLATGNSAYGNPYAWTGQRLDIISVLSPQSSVQLYHFQYRTYSPTLGRWLQRDPIGYAGGSVSLYEYVGSSAIGFFDPLGLDPLSNATQGGGGNNSPGSSPNGPNHPENPNDSDSEGDNEEAEVPEEEEEDPNAGQQLLELIDLLQEEINNETDPARRRELEGQKEYLSILLRQLSGDYRQEDEAWLAARGYLEQARHALQQINDGAAIAIVVLETGLDAGEIVIGFVNPLPGDEVYLATAFIIRIKNVTKVAKAAKAAKAVNQTGKVGKRSEALRKAWEKRYGKDWPIDPNTGKKLDVSHKRAKADGGSDNLRNIEPLPHDEHVRRHSENGDYGRWAKRRGNKP